MLVLWWKVLYRFINHTMNQHDDPPDSSITEHNQPTPLTKKSGYHESEVWAIVITSTLGMFVFGYLLSVINTVQSFLSVVVFKWDKETTVTYTSLLHSLVPIGAAVGAFAGGALARKVGRRKAMLITDFICLIGILLTLLESINVMLAGRFLSGLCVGLHSAIVPLYVSEISPLQIKGKSGSFNQIQLCLGILIAFLFGFGLPDFSQGSISEEAEASQWWRFVLGFPLIPIIYRIFALWMLYDFDTPAYLVNNRRDKEAKLTLDRIYTKSASVEQYEVLAKARDQNSHGGSVSFSTLFKSEYRSRLFIGCFIGILRQASGVNALVFYSTKIFKESSNGDHGQAVLYSTLFAVFKLLATIASSQVITRFGRKPLLIAGDIGMALALGGIVVLGYAGAVSVIIFPIFIYIIIFGLTYGPVPWIFIAEVLPDVGVGIAILLNWATAFLVAQFFQPLANALGTYIVFLIFAVTCLLSLIVLLARVKETRNLLPYEIAQLYSQPNARSSTTITPILITRL